VYIRKLIFIFLLLQPDTELISWTFFVKECARYARNVTKVLFQS